MRRESSRWLMISADAENKTGPLCGLSQRPGNEKRTCEDDASEKRPLEQSEIGPWHPSAIHLTLLTRTQESCSRNCAEVTPRPFSSATCWRSNDMWKTEKAKVHIKTCRAHIGGALITDHDARLPPFHWRNKRIRHSDIERGGMLVTRVLLSYAHAGPQCDRLDAICDTDEWNFWEMQSCEFWEETQHRSQEQNGFKVYQCNPFLLLKARRPLCPLLPLLTAEKWKWGCLDFCDPAQIYH